MEKFGAEDTTYNVILMKLAVPWHVVYILRVPKYRTV